MNKRLIVFSIISIVLLIGLFYLTFCSKYLKIQQIRMEGGERIHLPQVRSLTEPYVGVSIITANLNDLKQSMLHLPWIKEVRMIKKLPSTLIVKLKERKPYGLINLSDRGLFWVGEEGYILGKMQGEKEELSTENSTAGELVISGVGTVDTPGGERIKNDRYILAIQNLREMSVSFVKKFESLKFDSVQAILESTKGYRVLLPISVPRSKLNILQRLLEKIEGSKYLFIDLRFDNQVILTPQKS